MGVFVFGNARLSNSENEIPLEKIKWDLRERVNTDKIKRLKHSLRKYGILSPILVEGPDKEGNYYLIDGYLRLEAWKGLTALPRKIPCRIMGPPSNKLNRSKLRFHLHNTANKIIGHEEQRAIEDIQSEGGYTDEEIIEQLNPKKNRIKRMKISREIDENLREKVAKIRGSQHALETIMFMDVSEKIRKNLLDKLLKKEVTGEHADALLKVSKNDMFLDLNEEQKLHVIMNALNQSRFTKEEAQLLLLIEHMKSGNKEYNTYSSDWLKYLCSTFEELISYVHQDLQEMTSDKYRSRLRDVLGKLNSQFDWVWNAPYKEERKKMQMIVNNTYKTENTQSGYRFRKHINNRK